jgi:hypothetical protein
MKARPFDLFKKGWKLVNMRKQILAASFIHQLSVFFFFAVQVPDNQNTLVACEYCKDGKLYFNEPKLRAENHQFIAESKIRRKISFLNS